MQFQFNLCFGDCFIIGAESQISAKDLEPFKQHCLLSAVLAEHDVTITAVRGRQFTWIMNEVSASLDTDKESFTHLVLERQSCLDFEEYFPLMNTIFVFIQFIHWIHCLLTLALLL